MKPQLLGCKQTLREPSDGLQPTSNARHDKGEPPLTSTRGETRQRKSRLWGTRHIPSFHERSRLLVEFVEVVGLEGKLGKPFSTKSHQGAVTRSSSSSLWQRSVRCADCALPERAVGSCVRKRACFTGTSCGFPENITSLGPLMAAGNAAKDCSKPMSEIAVNI